MRIVLLLNGRFPTEKAYGIQTITMAEGYAALGHKVAIAYPRRSADVPKPIPGVAFLPFGRRQGLLVRWLFQPLRLFGALGASKAIDDFHPDIVIANDPLQAAIVSKSFPVIWELHDLPNLKRRGRRVLVKLVLKNVVGIVSTNVLKLEELKKFAVSMPPTTVLPNAVTFDPEVYRQIDRNAARRELEIPTEEKTIVYAGQLFDWKGVDTLISSAEFLPQDVVVHVVGGSGKDLERCKKLASNLPKTSARVEFHGMRPKEEIPKWLRAATLVVIPNSGKFEISIRDTSPLKLFEAFAAGAAIVASDLPSIREVADGNAGVVFVRPDEPKATAHGISKLTENLSEIEAMRNASKKYSHLLRSTDRAKYLTDFLIGLKFL